jgi:hypothetical protein
MLMPPKKPSPLAGEGGEEREDGKQKNVRNEERSGVQIGKGVI